MTPTRLQLRNFLSYGEAAPPLDFTEFHVACLSGGNGQGKSALLDAITWALWGEARKSSDLRKPDEELLRIGARQMEVDLTFRLDAAEYRVIRSFTQSASGKTSKPGLELQVRDGDGWRALTAENVRATQAEIDRRVGIDYETFINSTFLLQGRSDEFTKKKPGERKDILAKILGLDRYERLAAKAGARWAAVRTQIERLEAEAERLAEALEPVATWEADRAEVAARVEATAAEVEAHATAEAEAATTLAGLDAAAREAEAVRQALADLARRDAAARTETDALATRLAEGEALVAEAPAIEADHARYETLRTQRAALDEKAALYRGLDARANALALDVQKKQTEAEAAVERLKAAVALLESQIQDDDQRLADRARAEAAHAEALAARETLARLDALHARREAARKAIDDVDKQLANERGALVGRQAELDRAIADLTAKHAEPLPETDALQADVDAAEAATAEMERVRERGADRSADVKAAEAERAALEREAAALAEKRRRIETAAADTCPTCGTPLTDDHRAEVTATYDREARALDARRAALDARVQAATEARDALRVSYARLKAVVEAGTAATAALAAARQREARRAEDRETLKALRADVRQVQRTLDEDAFRPELRVRRAEAERFLDAHPLDADAHEAARAGAALVDHWAARLREMAVAAERRDARRAERDRKARDLQDARDALDRGDAVADLQTRLAALDAQKTAVGYDPDEHERVSRDAHALSDAPARLARLLDVRQRLAEWAERKATLAADRLRMAAETDTHTKRLDALTETLADRDAALTARATAAAARAEAAARLAEAQAALGALTERLDRAEADRAALTTTRSALRDARRERTLYGHLRRAFGKHGIPSLIIEETLPEIEARANVLLARLGDGTTRVALETLKEKKTGGGTKETLDIRITDAQGVARAYETFSGGEAFRVNFAVRIALSQMLAERSGTRIRTLVVDEGFGTQDKEGLQSLIGAIGAVQDDFDKILVITHLDELKAAFPVRIEVHKDPVVGSTYEVVGV